MKQEQYHKEFLAFKDQLQSFIFRMVSNIQDAEDIVQDTYLKVFEKLDTFRGDSSFKTWVFTIAMNQSKNHLAKQNKWLVDAQSISANLHLESEELASKLISIYQSKPEIEYEVKEHISYCFNCMVKTLEVQQQVCLWLKEVYNFKVDEIMSITGLSEGKVKHAIADARKLLTEIFEQKCAFVSKKGVCHQCTQLNGFLNPKQDAREKALKIKMVKEGDNPDKKYLLDLRLKLVQVIDPLNASNKHIHTYFLENSPEWVKTGLARNVPRKV